MDQTISQIIDSSGLDEEKKAVAKTTILAAAENKDALYGLVNIDENRSQVFQNAKDSFSSLPSGEENFSKFKALLESEEIQNMSVKDTSFGIFAKTALGVINSSVTNPQTLDIHDTSTDPEAPKKDFLNKLFDSFDFLKDPNPSQNKDVECAKIATAQANCGSDENFGSILTSHFKSVFEDGVKQAIKKSEKAAGAKEKDAADIHKSSQGYDLGDELEGQSKKKVGSSLQDIDGKTMAISGLSGIAAIAVMAAIPGPGVIVGLALLGFSAYNLSGSNKDVGPSESVDPYQEKDELMKVKSMLGSALNPAPKSVGKASAVIPTTTQNTADLNAGINGDTSTVSNSGSVPHGNLDVAEAIKETTDALVGNGSRVGVGTKGNPGQELEGLKDQNQTGNGR